MPRLSVIVPVYNASAYIDRCISSILEQSFTDFEVIFVDDGSTDGSPQIVTRFARNDSRILLQRHDRNQGPGAARNTGIARARASYLTFVDSDDFIDTNMLARLFEAADGGFFDIVESGCRAIDEEDELVWEYTPVPAKLTDLATVADSMLLVREWGMPQKLWKKSLFTENQISFPQDVFWEDIAVVPSLVICARTLAKIDYTGYNYVQHLQSITNTRSLKHIADLFRAYEYFKKFLINRGLYARQRGSFDKSVNKTVQYFISHMQEQNLRNPEMSERLIQICRITAQEYLADGPLAGQIASPKLDEAIKSALELESKQPDAAVRAAIVTSLGDRLAN